MAGMAKTPGSPLTAAAASFDEVLATYARLAELFVKTPLTNVKQLERANATLDELAACEPKLQAAAQVLLGALGDARSRQEQLAGEVVAHAPTLQRRNQELRALMDEMAKLAEDVSQLNSAIATDPAASGDAAAPDVGDVGAKVLAMSERAEQLADAARTAEFEEIATQAHALHQRLLVIGKKLQRAAPN